METKFIISWYKLPIENKFVKIVQQEVFLLLSKTMYEAHGYKLKDFTKEQRKDPHQSIEIDGSLEECEAYQSKMENFGLNKVNETIQAIKHHRMFKFLPNKIRKRMTGIHHSKENNAMDKIKSQLLPIGIVLDYYIPDKEKEEEE